MLNVIILLGGKRLSHGEVYDVCTLLETILLISPIGILLGDRLGC